jgi:ribosomal protein L14
MNKKIRVLGIALIMLCVAAVVVFAAGDRVSFSSSDVTVSNTNRKGKITVEVCVTLKDSRGRTSDTTWTFEDIPAGKSQTQKAPGGTTVTGASSTYCSIPTDE